MANFELKTDGGKCVLALAGDIGIQEAKALHGALTEAVGSCESLDLDLSAVEGGDLTLLQLLCAAEKAMSAKGASIGLAGAVSQPVLELAEEAGYRHEGAGQRFWTREG